MKKKVINKIRIVIKELVPPIWFKLNRIGQSNIWYGNYRTWKKAKIFASGYDSEIILKKTCDAMLKVKNGGAAYERDSVLFKEIHYTYPILAALMWVAAVNSGNLNVLDFGGSFGSTFFQNKKFLDTLKSVNWNIVEQEMYVEIGKKHFENNIIKFYSSLKDCMASGKPDVILFSGVLQYLENPYYTIKEAISSNFKYIIIDRTPVHNGDDDIITIQRIHKNISDVSYPSWLLLESKLIKTFKEYGYSQFLKFDSLEGTKSFNKLKVTFRGYLFVKH